MRYRSAPFRVRPDSTIVRGELNIPPGTFVIGHVGRFHPQKNHNFLISRFTDVVTREPSTLLLLIGQGELEGDVMRRVKREGLSDHVRFLGVRPDVPRLMMAAMDVFLFPSLYEGLGIVLLEAQAAGLLSVVSDVIPEEADVVKPLVIRLPLSQTPDFWAGRILACRPHACLRSSPDCAPLMKGGISTLVGVYRGSWNCIEVLDLARTRCEPSLSAEGRQWETANSFRNTLEQIILVYG